MSASNPGEEWGTAVQAATDALDAVLDMGAPPETGGGGRACAAQLPLVSQPDPRPRKRRRRHAASGSDQQAAAAAAATTTRHLLGATQRQVMLLSQHVAYLHGMASARVAACSQVPEWGLRATAEDAMGAAGLDRFLTGGHFAEHPVRSTFRALCERKKRPRAHREWRFGAAPLVFTGVPA